jgi:hypothetical protein
MLPIQAAISVWVCVQELVFRIPDLPLLRSVVEFDVGGSANLQPSKLMKGHSFGPQAPACAVRREGDDVFTHNFMAALMQ